MLKQQLQKPETFLYLFAAAMPIYFASWQALINNFSIEQVGFTGYEIGVLQSLREIPGFLAFAVVFLLLLMGNRFQRSNGSENGGTSTFELTTGSGS